MAESIVTLGIGGTPDNLTPFVTTGLFIGAGVEPTPAAVVSPGYTRLGLQLLTEPGGELLADFSDAVECLGDNGAFGFRSLECVVDMPLDLAFVYYDLVPKSWLILSSGGGVVWEGRVEDRAIVTNGLRLMAFGAWRAMADLPYTALWSDSSVAGWQILPETVLGSPNRFVVDNNNRLYLAPKKNETHSNSTTAFIGYQIPDDSTREIVGIQFDYVLNAPANWEGYLDARNSSYGFLTNLWLLAGTGSAQSGSVHLSHSACAGFTFRFRYNTTAAVYTGETGDTYLRITNIRLVTTTANQVNTTTTTTISAGSDRVVTPASMARITVGQRLFIDSGSSPSESVVVTAVTSTTFTATFINGYSGTTTIQAHVVYADEIIKDLVSHVTGVNPDQLSADTSLIESPGLDLADEVYEDAYPADIAIKLAGLGDDQSPPRRWEVGVWENRRLHFRPRGSGGRTWFVDADNSDLESTLETLYNSTYGLYQDASGRTLRTPVADDADSQARYGIVRRRPVSAVTTSATQAAAQRDAMLEDGRVISPRAIVTFEYLSDRAGAIYPKWMLRAGDTMALTNLPAAASEEIDRVRTFVVTECSYDAIADVASPVPEEAPASLELLVARRDEGL